MIAAENMFAPQQILQRQQAIPDELYDQLDNFIELDPKASRDAMDIYHLSLASFNGAEQAALSLGLLQRIQRRYPPRQEELDRFREMLYINCEDSQPINAIAASGSVEVIRFIFETMPEIQPHFCKLVIISATYNRNRKLLADLHEDGILPAMLQYDEPFILWRELFAYYPTDYKFRTIKPSIEGVADWITFLQSQLVDVFGMKPLFEQDVNEYLMETIVKPYLCPGIGYRLEFFKGLVRLANIDPATYLFTDKLLTRRPTYKSLLVTLVTEEVDDILEYCLMHYTTEEDFRPTDRPETPAFQKQRRELLPMILSHCLAYYQPGRNMLFKDALRILVEDKKADLSFLTNETDDQGNLMTCEQLLRTPKFARVFTPCLEMCRRLILKRKKEEEEDDDDDDDDWVAFPYFSPLVKSLRLDLV